MKIEIPIDITDHDMVRSEFIIRILYFHFSSCEGYSLAAKHVYVAVTVNKMLT